MASSEAQITIDGEVYDLPESFTLGELRIIDRYSGGHGSDDGYVISKMMGAIHVAIKRVKPNLSFEEIEQRIEEIDPADLPSDEERLPLAAVTSDEPKASEEDSRPASDASQENGSQESSGSPALDTGFTSFHSISST